MASKKSAKYFQYTGPGGQDPQPPAEDMPVQGPQPAPETQVVSEAREGSNRRRKNNPHNAFVKKHR